jgi:hypothetical protein
VLIGEFLELLNAEANLYGQRRVIARTVEDWGYENLISAPTRIHGHWEWPEQSLADGKEVMAYRRRGFKRVAAVQAQWWLEGRNFPVREIREAVISEYARARNLGLRQVSSAHGVRRDVDLTEYRRLALRRQLGPLDPTLKEAGFDFGAAVVTASYEFARFGELISPIDKNKEPIAAFLASATLPNGVHFCAGLLETDDTHPLSAVRAMRQLTNEQFEECRNWIELLPAGLVSAQMALESTNADEPKRLAFTAAINSWSIWPWRIVTFALAANIYYHSQMETVDNG